MQNIEHNAYDNYLNIDSDINVKYLTNPSLATTGALAHTCKTTPTAKPL